MLFDGESITRRWGDSLYGGEVGVTLVLRGQWQPGVTYLANDLVYWDNAIYRALQETTIAAPVAVGDTGAIHAPGLLALPAGTQVNDLIVVGLVVMTPSGATIVPTIPDGMTLFAEQDISYAGGHPVAASLTWQGVDATLLAAGGITVPAQGAGPFAAFIMSFRNGVLQSNSVPFLNYVDMSATLAVRVAGIALTGSGSVTTDVDGFPDSAFGLGAYFDDDNFGGAMAYSKNLFEPNVAIQEPTLTFHDTLGSGGNNPSIASGVLPLAVPSDYSQNANWELFGTRLTLGAARGSLGIAVGASSGVASGTNSTPIAIGNSAYADSDCVALGTQAETQGAYGVAIGAHTNAAQSEAIAIGHGAQALGQYSISIGNGWTAGDNGAIAINGTASAVESVAINGHASGVNSVAVGNGAHADADFACAYGDDARAIALGAVAIGPSTRANTEGTIAIGVDNTGAYPAAATGNNAIAIGGHAVANGINALSIGAATSSAHNGAVAIGADSLGNGAAAGSDNDFVLGTATHTVRAPGTLAHQGAHLGFFNATPVVKQAVPTDLASVISLLQEYGLC